MKRCSGVPVRQRVKPWCPADVSQLRRRNSPTGWAVGRWETTRQPPSRDDQMRFLPSVEGTVHGQRVLCSYTRSVPGPILRGRPKRGPPASSMSLPLPPKPTWPRLNLSFWDDCSRRKRVVRSCRSRERQGHVGCHILVNCKFAAPPENRADMNNSIGTLGMERPHWLRLLRK